METHIHNHFHLEPIRDMFVPIMHALQLTIPPYPTTPFQCEIEEKSGENHITILPSLEFLDWRDQIIALLNRGK